MADYEEKNQGFAQEIAQKEETLTSLCLENQSRTDAIDRLNQEKLELEGERIKATQGEPEQKRGAAPSGGRSVPPGAEEGFRLHGGEAASGQAVGEL